MLSSVVTTQTCSTRSAEIRNIAVIAHIDAGKTTLTERMLFHAGLIRRIGSVDRGDTVMDYLPQERSRGITIKAACISIPWRQTGPAKKTPAGSTINIIDTPGHVDFTVEVERAVRVIEGAVACIDGSAGVQAQTVTVWRQAGRCGVARIVFVNKLDKAGADFAYTVKDIESRFKTKTVCLNRPLYNHATGELEGVFDVLTNEHIYFRGDHGGDLVRVSNPVNAQERIEMCEVIAERDEQFLEAYLEDQNQPVSAIMEAIKRLAGKSLITPVLAGSAFRNIGVQPVLDAIIDYLPQPQDLASCGTIIALAFKVVCDAQRGGLLVFVRVYSGVITNRTVLTNVSRREHRRERVSRVLRAAGRDLIEVESAFPGQIAVLVGCKATATGDTLSSSLSAEPLAPIVIPQPVFQMACSNIQSQVEEDRVEDALHAMSLEDPSLRVEKDENTGQLVISGMGELHLEIAGQRLREDHKCNNVRFDNVKIAYMEHLTVPVAGELQYERTVGGIRQSGLVSLELEPLPMTPDGGFVPTDTTIDVSSDALRCPKTINSTEFINSVKDGLFDMFRRGPLRQYKVAGLRVIVKKAHWIDPDTTIASIGQCAAQLIRNLYSAHSYKFQLIEPVMTLSIQCDARYLGTILPNLHSNRRATVFGYGHTTEGDAHGDDGDAVGIEAEAPLSELVGYVTWLRTATSGNASLSMQLAGYKPAAL